MPLSLAARTLVAASLLLLPLPAAADTGGDEDPFVFVSLPDTQIYAENRVPDGRTPAVTDVRGTGAIFFDQTEWIVENAQRLGIRYVGHLGDIVQHGNELDEWDLAHQAMHLLRDVDLPHGTVMGNHDDNHGPDYRRNYLQYFGPQEFQDRPWFTASSPGGGANLVVLEHRHRKIGFLNFSIDQPQAEIDWATEVVESNPDTIFIVGTHRYLYDFKLVAGRYGESVSSPLGTIQYDDNLVDQVVEPNRAQEFFEEFVSQHPNILMIHAGHFHAEWLRLDDQNAGARTLIQILTDYQSTRNGGDGWLRLYEMDFEAGTFHFDTWSPTLDRRRTTFDHFVETIYLVHAQREQIKDFLGIPDDTVYFTLLNALLKQTPAPDGFLLEHPEYDEPEERAYYQQYLEDLFLGDPPEGFEDITEFENLWLTAFAIDSEDPYDFRPSSRSPSGTLQVDFSEYFTPSPDQLVAFAFEDLLAALEGLERGDFLTPWLQRLLTKRVEQAFGLAERSRTDAAAYLLEKAVLVRTDGCAARGRPDSLWGSLFFWFLKLFTFDWIDDCEAQGQVQPLLVETLEHLEAHPSGRFAKR